MQGLKISFGENGREPPPEHVKVQFRPLQR